MKSSKFVTRLAVSALLALTTLGLSACGAQKTETAATNQVNPTAYVMFFAKGSKKLSSDEVLQRLAKDYADQKFKTLTVVGFRDSTEPNNLAKLRAVTVGNALIKLGIPKTAISLVANDKGEVGSNIDDPAVSRRVEVFPAPLQ